MQKIQKLSIVRITKNLSFEDIRTGKIPPIDAYHIQIRDWILEPAKHLAKLPGTDHGMALLSLELIVFEAHGQYLTGKDSDGKSKETFCEAFEEFRKFLISQNLVSGDINEFDSKNFYKFARCGLFHSLKLGKDLLVDAVNYSKTCLSRNYVLGGDQWLVNPWLMLRDLEQYIDSYVLQVRNEPDGELSKNFHKTFERLIKEPIRYFSS